jgi:hypothetical protein
MGLHKGQCNNRNGKPMGATSKAKNDLRERVSALIDANFESIQTDLDLLESKDRLAFIEKLLKYCLPTLQSVESKTDLSNLSDAQLDQIINSINISDNE